MPTLQQIYTFDVTPKKFIDKGHNPKHLCGRKTTWTPEEDAILRKMWPSVSGLDIAKRLNRNYKTVMSYASKLGLRKNNSPKQIGNARKEPEPIPEAEDSARRRRNRAEPRPEKKMIFVRVDKRTVVQVPEGTDIEKVKAKYNKS